MHNLNNCKKCGYDKARIIRYGHFDGRSITYRISCPQCGYCTKEKDTLKEAEDAWNDICKPMPSKSLKPFIDRIINKEKS